jgi:hypothetical protein
LNLRQKDILDICKEFFIDPNTGLIINFDYFKNIEEYKKTTKYKEFKDSIEKIICNNGTFEASAKKLKNTGDIPNPDGPIEDFEYFTHPEKFTLKNEGKAKHAKLAQEAESPSRLHQSIVHNAFSTNAQIQTEYKIFYMDNNQQHFYIFSFVDKEIFFPLITLNYLLGEKEKEYVYRY